MKKELMLPQELILSKIFEFRGHKVILDSDLAELYDVETKVLNQAVRRNHDIFPSHFMFELTEEEHKTLRSQSVTSKSGRGGRRYLPMVFTEHGVLQVANVLRSKRARHMSVRIIDVFILMREMLQTHQDLYKQLEIIREKISGHEDQIALIFEYLKQFEQAKRETLEQQNRVRIGFKGSGNRDKE